MTELLYQSIYFTSNFWLMKAEGTISPRTAQFIILYLKMDMELLRKCVKALNGLIDSEIERQSC